MADMLVKLYTLSDVAPALAELKQQGIEIRQAHPPDKNTIADWVRQHFGDSWAVGCEVACLHEPVLCYIAVQKENNPTVSASPYDLPAETLLGFACYDVAAKGMFGPEGVREDYRGRGIGTALLLTTLHAMAAQRYVYAVIGWAGPVEFYTKTVGATLIEDSEPGIFRGPLARVRNPQENTSMSLMQTQVRQFREDGYLVADDVVTANDLEPVIEEYATWIDQKTLANSVGIHAHCV